MALTLENNPLELFIPASSPATPPSLTALGTDWFVAKTKSQQEKSLARFLFNAGVAYMLPMIARRTASRNTVLLPLFPGFVFIQGIPFPPSARFNPALSAENLRHRATRNAADLAISSRHTCGFIWAGNQPELLRELQVIASESAHRRTLRHESPKALRKGMTVQVISGGLFGNVGKFIAPAANSSEARGRIILEMKTLGQVVSVEIDAAEVEAI